MIGFYWQNTRRMIRFLPDAPDETCIHFLGICYPSLFEWMQENQIRYNFVMTSDRELYLQFLNPTEEVQFLIARPFENGGSFDVTTVVDLSQYFRVIPR